MAGITVKADDVIAAPNAEVYNKRGKNPLIGKIADRNMGTALLMQETEDADADSGVNRYEEALRGTNLQRQKVADTILAAQKLLEERNQTLDYGASLKENIDQAPIMEQAGVAGAEGQGSRDQMTRQLLAAKIMKERAEAGKASSEGRGPKSPIEFRTDEFGRSQKIIKDPLRALNDPLYSEMLTPEERERMSSGKRTAINDIAQRASEASKPVAPTGGQAGKAKYNLASPKQLPDGNFEAEVVGSDGKSRGRFVVDSSGKLLKRADQ